MADVNEPVKIIAPSGGEPIITSSTEPVVTPVTPVTPIVSSVQTILTSTPYDDSKFDKFSKDVLSKSFESTEGIFVDKDGNFVNEKNEIILDKIKFDTEKLNLTNSFNTAVTDYVSKLENFTLEVNGKSIDCKLDANKNVVDDKGNPVMSSVELTKYVADNFELEDLLQEEDDTDEDFISKVAKLSGYEPIDQNGNPIQFESNLEGIAKYVAYTVENEASQLANDKLDAFISTYPDLEDVINYITINGSLKNYNPYKDYSDIVIDSKDEQSMYNIIIEAEIAAGRSNKDAKEYADLIKDNNMLESKAKDKLSFLKAQRQIQLDERSQLALQANIQRQNDIENSINNIKSIVNSGKIQNWVIPEVIKIKQSDGIIKSVPRTAFIDFVTKPVDKGLTMDQILQQKETLSQQLFVSYLRFTGGDLTQLVKNEADNQLVEKFRNTKKRIVIGQHNSNSISSFSNKVKPPIQNR